MFKLLAGCVALCLMEAHATVHHSLRKGLQTSHLGYLSAYTYLLQNDDTNAAKDRDIFLRYMPGHNMVVCGCGKCGSSSMYSYLYEHEMGMPWPYKDRPYVQNVTSSRWEDRFEIVPDGDPKQEEVMGKAYSYALVRDPKERLVSAWMSKVACNVTFGVDRGDRSFLVPDLKRLHDRPDVAPMRDPPCLTLQEFAQLLHDVHEAGKGRMLDRHFLPQTMGCFRRFNASKWTKVVTMQDPDALPELARRMGRTNVSANVPHAHKSSGQVWITELAAQLLDNVTSPEYELLRDYLPRPSTVKPGWFVLS